jgi:hypothetical protein
MEQPSTALMSAPKFTTEQLEALRTQGIVLFANRVIFNAQPPMPDVDIAQVQRQCAGILPPALIRLWKTTAGGSLDYGLSLSMGPSVEAISWVELFYNHSDGYRDLQGWIEHELELLEESADDVGSAAKRKLEYVPIGGFEYCDRIYACVVPGPEYGRVIAWKQGLPPAWRHRLHEDSVAKIADDLEGAFAALSLECDPLEPVDEYFSGQHLLGYIEERVTEHGMSRDLADALIAHYRQAIVDWRAFLASGELQRNRRASCIAIEHAILADDRQLIRELARGGMKFNSTIQGSAVPLEIAVSKGSLAVAEELLAQGVGVPESILAEINGSISADLVAALLRHGAHPSIDAAVQCVSIGATDCANLIIDACRKKNWSVQKEFEKAKAALLADHEDYLAKMKSGQPFGHYLGIDGLEKRVAALKSFEFPVRKSSFLRLLFSKT